MGIDRQGSPQGSYKLLQIGGKIEHHFVPSSNDIVKTKAVKFDRFSFCTRHDDCTCKTKEAKVQGRYDIDPLPCLVDGQAGDMLDCALELFIDQPSEAGSETSSAYFARNKTAK